jgi:predicted RNase H-like nuclease
MGRIVAYVHHYKRSPRKRKAVALEMPTVVATKKSRRPDERATAEAIPRSPRLQDEALQPNTVRDAECDGAP